MFIRCQAHKHNVKTDTLPVNLTLKFWGETKRETFCWIFFLVIAHQDKKCGCKKVQQLRRYHTGIPSKKFVLFWQSKLFRCYREPSASIPSLAVEGWVVQNLWDNHFVKIWFCCCCISIAYFNNPLQEIWAPIPGKVHSDTTVLVDWAKTSSYLLNYLGKATEAAGAVPPMPASVCSMSVCPYNGMMVWLSRVWDF